MRHLIKAAARIKSPIVASGLTLIGLLWVITGQAEVLGQLLTAIYIGAILGSFVPIFIYSIKSWERERMQANMQANQYVEVRAIDALLETYRKHGLLDSSDNKPDAAEQDSERRTKP